MLNIIRTRLFSVDIAEMSLYYWDNLLLLLMRNRIPFSEVLTIYEEILSRNLTTNSEIIKLFSDWTFSKTLKIGDSILPIIANLKLIELI